MGHGVAAVLALAISAIATRLSVPVITAILLSIFALAVVPASILRRLDERRKPPKK